MTQKKRRRYPTFAEEWAKIQREYDQMIRDSYKKGEKDEHPRDVRD